MQSALFRSFSYIFIFLTGAAGLIYQVTWHKYLSVFLGSDSMATAIILAVFLGGLSLGYYLCGKWTTRVSNQFKAYAILEGVIGAWCVFFPGLMALVWDLTRNWAFAPLGVMIFQGVLCSVALMGVPTICMGGTLPFLTRGLSANVEDATRVHAKVYGVNTAGGLCRNPAGGLCACSPVGASHDHDEHGHAESDDLYFFLFRRPG